jgi:disulfide oxidoreductase YuzD
MDYKTEFGIRLDKLEASSEMEIYRNLQALRASHRVFNGNYYELMRCLNHLKDPREALAMYAPEQRENLELLIDESSRLFHNFLASAKSLVDHTRVIVDRLYLNHEFRNEYQRKLDQEIANNPVQKFVQKMRNYTQHYTLPILALQISFTGDIEMSVCVDVKILKQWGKDNWGSPVMAYLETLADDFCLTSLSSEYFTLVQDFYRWLAERQTQIHQSDFDKLQKMKDELTI